MSEAWTCTTCTLINSSNFLCCDACHAVKAHSVRVGAVFIELDSLCVIGTNENLVIKIQNSIKKRVHLDEVNMIIDECMSNRSNNLCFVNKLATKLKDDGVLSTSKMNILSFSVYWPAFVAALNNPYERRSILSDECIRSHWEWWIVEAGNPNRLSDHWRTIKATMMSGLQGPRMDIRDLAKERCDVMVFSYNGMTCTFEHHSKKFQWRLE